MAVSCLVLAGFALNFPIRHWLQYHTFAPVKDPVIIDGLGYMSPLFLGFGFIFLLWAFWFSMSARNQSISIFHGTISWRGATGKMRINCRYEEVVTLSFRQSWHKHTYSCEVGTTRGPIRWDSNISSADQLLRLAKTLAKQHETM